jgi:hypothetical protein
MVPCINPVLKKHSTIHAPTPCYNRMLQSHDIRNFPCSDHTHQNILYPNPMLLAHAKLHAQGSNCMSEPNALVLVPKPKLTEPCIHTFPWFCACIALFCFCALWCQKLCTDAIIGAFLGYSSLKRQHAYSVAVSVQYSKYPHLHA